MYDEWFKLKLSEMDRLLCSTKCQFMDMRFGARTGKAFLSANFLVFVMEDSEDPAHNIYVFHRWEEVKGWVFGIKEMTASHPFYKVVPTPNAQAANAIRLFIEGRSGKVVRTYVHCLTSIPPPIFFKFVSYLDASYRLHNSLPQFKGVPLSTPPQKQCEAQSPMTPPSGMSPAMSPAVSPAPNFSEQPGAGAAPNPAMMSQSNPMMNTMMSGMNPAMMNSSATPAGMNPAMMGMMNPTTMGTMNPAMMGTMNPAMMQQMQQQQMMMMMMMMRQQQFQQQQQQQQQQPFQGAGMSLQGTAMPGVVATPKTPSPQMAPPPSSPVCTRSSGTPSPTGTGGGVHSASHIAEDEFADTEESAPKSFKIAVKRPPQNEQWQKLLSTLSGAPWDMSPVKMLALSQRNTGAAMDLLEKKDWRHINELIASNTAHAASDPSCDIYFGTPGAQVAVESDLKQEVIFSLNEPQKMSYKVITMKHPKYRMTVEPAEGTLTPDVCACKIALTLRMRCTTSVDLEIPVIFWRGSAKHFDKIIQSGQLSADKMFVCYIRSKVQSRLSTRLNVEDLQLYRPPIGKGSYGTVFRGKYRGLEVAFKMLNNQTDLTEEEREGFDSEVVMFETLRHPCIVNFIGAVTMPGSLGMVTELCKYGSLCSAMKKYGPSVWTMGMKVKALYDCARAMDFLHQSSIIHRDLKPDNMLVSSLEFHSPEICKLSDFGTTKGTNSMIHEMSMTKGMGTPLYMAPEVMSGTCDYTNKADVYSFGIMIASVVDDGATPYEGDPRIKSSWQFSSMVIQGMRPNVAKEAEMSPDLKELMHRCWDANPELRPTFDTAVRCLESMLESFDH